MKSSTETIISAMRKLAGDIQSEDGVANACIAEAADRLEEFAESQVFERLRVVEQHFSATREMFRALRLAAKDAVDAMEEAVQTIGGVSEHISDRFISDSLWMAKTDLRQALDSLDGLL